MAAQEYGAGHDGGQGGQNGAVIQFNGRGYRGNIEAIDQFPESIAGIGDVNVTTVTISPTS